MSKSEIHPKVGQVFTLEVKVISIKYKKGGIVVRLVEKFSESRFNLTYKQTELNFEP